MAKLISLVIITPLLVMTYTTIQNTISPKQVNQINQTQGAVTGATPVSIGLMDKTKTPPVDNINSNENNEYMLVRSIWGKEEKGLNGASNSQAAVASNRFALVLL